MTQPVHSSTANGNDRGGHGRTWGLNFMQAILAGISFLKIKFWKQFRCLLFIRASVRRPRPSSCLTPCSSGSG